MPAPSAPFSVTYDRTTRVLSALVCAGLLVLAVALQSVAVGCLSGLVILLAYAYSPRRYVVSEASIMVERLIGKVHVPLGGLREARVATPDDFSGCIRLWGSGGLFGYYGLYRTASLGKCHWYVTNRQKAIVM